MRTYTITPILVDVDIRVPLFGMINFHTLGSVVIEFIFTDFGEIHEYFTSRCSSLSSYKENDFKISCLCITG